MRTKTHYLPPNASVARPLMDPVTRARLRDAVDETAYEKGYVQGQKDQAPAVLILALICAVAGALLGGGVVGVLVAIF